MQNFKEFLEENYNMTEDQFESVGEYEKHIINAEYDEYMASIAGDNDFGGYIPHIREQYSWENENLISWK